MAMVGIGAMVTSPAHVATRAEAVTFPSSTAA